MNRLPRLRPFARLALFLIVMSAAAISARADAMQYDCGTMSLYALLRSEGRLVSLRDVEVALPDPPPKGYSLKQLKDAARKLGVRLAGFKMSKENFAVRQTMLAFVAESDHGHYFVARPIGRTGKLVQIIDSSIENPEVIDASELVNADEWTGAVLVVDQAGMPHACAVAALIVGCLMVAALTLVTVRNIRRHVKASRSHVPGR